MVLQYIEANPSQELTPRVVSKALDKSSGAIGNALERFVEKGVLIRSNQAPRRYRLAPSVQPQPTAAVPVEAPALTERAAEPGSRTGDVSRPPSKTQPVTPTQPRFATKPATPTRTSRRANPAAAATTPPKPTATRPVRANTHPSV